MILKIKYWNNAILILLFLSFYFSEWLSSNFEAFSDIRAILFTLVWMLFFFKIIASKRLEFRHLFLFYGIVGFFLALISFLIWNTSGAIYTYLGIWSALLVLDSDISKFKKLVGLIIIIEFILVIIEYSTKSYFFINTRVVNSELIVMDEEFYGGTMGIFRAKGLFSGPLSVGQFTIASSLLLNRRYFLVVLNLLTAFFANSRLGILCISLILCYSLYHNHLKYAFFSKTPFLSKRILFLFLFMIGSLPIVLRNIDYHSVQRIFSVFDLGDSANFARIYYWKAAWAQFLDFPLIYKVFGNPGYFRLMVSNSAENSFLNLLLENGILGLFFYLIPIFTLLVLSLKRQLHFTFLVLLVIFSMFVQTFYLGASANLLLWLFVLNSIDDLLKRRNEKSIDFARVPVLSR